MTPQFPLALPTSHTLRPCTGVARVGICIPCDRLYLAGDPIKPAAKRADGAAYSCKNQVIDGKPTTAEEAPA